MRNPSPRLSAGIALSLILVSVQPAVPAAAQVVGAGAAARGGVSAVSAAAVSGRLNTATPMALQGTISPLSAPSISVQAPLLNAPAGAAPTVVPSAAAPAAVTAQGPARAASMPSVVVVPAAPALSGTQWASADGPAGRKHDAPVRPASLPVNAAQVDGAKFDGAIAQPAAAPVPGRFSKAVRLAASPAVGAWTKTSSAVSNIKENATWVRGFWSGLRADGVDVRKELRTASAMALVIAAVSLVPSWLYGQMAQHLHDLQGLAASGVWWQNPVLQTFGALSGGLIFAHALGAYLTKFQSRTMYDLGNKLMKGVSDLYVKKVLSLDMRWQNSRNVGDVVSTATDAIYTLQSTASAMIVDLVRNGSVALIAGAVMVAVSWKISLFAIPFLIFALSIPSSVYGKRVQDAYKSFFAMKKPKFASALQEIVVNMLKVKAAGLEERELEKMREFSRQTYIVGGGEIADVAAPQRALAGGLTDVARVVVMGAAILGVIFGVMPLSAAVTYIFLSNYFREAVQALTGLWVSLKSMRGAATRYDNTMKQASENLNLGGTVLPPTATGRKIEMRGVKFRYTKDGAPILKGVDLTINPGEMVGFVGMTGGGKTTTAMTVLGLYPLESGEVLIDGVPLSQLDLRAFRKEIGVSLQDSIPFAASIRDNIAYLRPGASDAEVWAAAKASGLHDQVLKFGADRVQNPAGADKDEAALIAKIKPALDAAQGDLSALAPEVLDDVARLGYRTRVGERGLNLSGGQKQRLMLAQIFISPQNPFGVMIYDEPTSALDGRTQSLIEDQIAARRGKTTQIVIAHRLSNVQRADKIVVFADGQVAEQGTHAELMAKGGVYAKMWDAQRLLDAAAESAATH